MSGWDVYDRRRDALGRTKREMWVEHTRTNYLRKMLESPSCRDVRINGEDQTVCIVHTAEMQQKKIFSLPGEHLEHGGIVDFEDNKWLITELDADNLIYDRGIMQQCNHILRWISKDGTLKEKWCYVADGTKSGLPHSPCLACWKRHAITTPLIAGTSLEPKWDWTISSEAQRWERSTTIPVEGVHLSRRKWGALNYSLAVAW